MLDGRRRAPFAVDRHVFAGLLMDWFTRHGRASLPWRTKRTPYRVVVSEFMLQQTQVDRVVPLFEDFIARWPSFRALAAGSQADVVRAWRGLGYNSRAVRLHRLAKAVVAQHGGTLPDEEAVLRALPGIGPYTARAVRAFAFNADVLAADTNIRRILHRTQFGVEWPPRANAVRLEGVGSALVPPGGGYAFNSALMDLGAALCTARAPKCLLCPLQRVCVAAPLDAAVIAPLAKLHAPRRGPQERLPFEATTRYVRGRVIERLRMLLGTERISLADLYRDLGETCPHHDGDAFTAIVKRLETDEVVDVDALGVRLRH